MEGLLQLGLERWVLVASLVSVLSACIVWVMKRVARDGGGQEIGIPRGTSGWPLIGESLEFISSHCSSNPVSFMEKRRALYGNIFRTHILGKSIIMSTDAEANKQILLNHGDAFKPSYPKSVQEIFGEVSLLELSGPPHKRMHGLVGSFLKSPVYKLRITRYIEKAVEASLSTWVERSGPVYVQFEVKKIAFEILVRSLFSIGPGEEMNYLKAEFEEIMKGLICLPIKLPGTQLYKSLKAKKRLIQRLNKIVKEKKMGMEKTRELELSNDVLDLLLRDGTELEEMMQRRLTDDFFSENIFGLMIPGEESVPTSMTLVVKFLSDHPVALAQLVEENMELKKRKQESGEEYSWGDYLTLAFTQNVISETLRLTNIVNAVWRKAVKDVRLKGYLIPKGWNVMACFSSVHMDEANYKNPYDFNPWRWKDMRVIANTNVFTAFGGGQRLCPGSELTRLENSIFLHYLVTTYRWSAEKDEITYFPTVRMKNRLPITVTPLDS